MDAEIIQALLRKIDEMQSTTHAVCCAHLLRELNGVMENHPNQTWAQAFKKKKRPPGEDNPSRF